MEREQFELEKIAVPVLLVWGDRDRLVFARGAERVLETVPDARLELLKGSVIAPRWRPQRGSPSCCCSSVTSAKPRRLRARAGA